MDAIERNEHEATRRHLKAILGIEGDSGLNNAELAARVEDWIARKSFVPRCPTCRHWIELYGNGRSLVENPDRVGVCRDIEHQGVVYRPRLAADKIAGTLDGEGYDAVVIASEHFGCVLHEPKEES